ncbi:MAG: UDP-glucose 4-epimerase GalE [Pseudomonadota bacterium]
MARILVTGGAGYVGSHTCKALANAGHQPIVYDNLVHGFRAAVQWGPLEIGDLLDQERIDQVIKAHRPEAVVHFGGYIAAGESVNEPGLYYHQNVTGSLALLEAMRQNDLKTIVFSSTAAVYGDPEFTPIPEDHPLKPINPYGHSKLMVEQVLADHAHAHGTSYAALRYFNASGADPEGEIGECHDPETHLIPLVIHAALGIRDKLTIFGTDYDTPDGTAIRDYIHVADLASAHVAALDHLMSGGASTAINLGTGNGYSVREIIECVQRVTGKPVPHVEADRRPGDPPILVADARKAMDVLSWKAKQSTLDDLIANATQWERGGRHFPLAKAG